MTPSRARARDRGSAKQRKVGPQAVERSWKWEERQTLVEGFPGWTSSSSTYHAIVMSDGTRFRPGPVLSFLLLTFSTIIHLLFVALNQWTQLNCSEYERQYNRAPPCARVKTAFAARPLNSPIQQQLPDRQSATAFIGVQHSQKRQHMYGPGFTHADGSFGAEHNFELGRASVSRRS